MNIKVFRIAGGLALGLAILTGATSIARADDGDERKVVEKRRVVIVDKDGKRQEFEGDGPMMRRGYLGVGLTDLTPELRAHFGVPEEAGAMVSRVEPGSPAEKAGIKVGDILGSIDGKDVKSTWDVMAKVRGLDDGQQVPVQIWRNGKAQNVTVAVVLRERPEIDMGPLFFKGKDGDGEERVIHLRHGGPGMHEELEDGPPGAEREIRIRHMTSPREMELEKKMKELEKRIDDLQKQLEKQKG